MIVPSDRLRFNNRPWKRRSLARALLPFAALAPVVAGLLIWQWPNIRHVSVRDAGQQVSLSDLWNRQRYEEINDRCEDILQKTPMNRRALIYNGYAYFYRGIGQFSLEEKIPFFDEAIKNLRIALIFDTQELVGQISYILGKAYHFKGKYYADLAIHYLTEAERNGHVGEDTYEYLGLAYSGIGDYGTGARFFQRAVDASPTDMRYLALAQAYRNAGDLVSSEEYLLRALNKTQDVIVELRARFLLGSIYVANGLLPKAEDQYKKIIERGANSADAHYHLGEIYAAYGKTIEARAEWRKALLIDSSHYGARLRYYR